MRVQEKYNVFEEGVERAMEKVRTEESRRTNAQGQPALIEVLLSNNRDNIYIYIEKLSNKQTTQSNIQQTGINKPEKLMG